MYSSKKRYTHYWAKPFGSSYKALLCELPNGVRMIYIRRNPRTSEYLYGYEKYCGRCFTNFEDEYAHQCHRTHGGKSYSRCLDPESIDLEAFVNRSGALVWKCKD